MPKNLLKKALDEVRKSKTSTRSLANNPAFVGRCPYTPPHILQGSIPPRTLPKETYMPPSEPTMTSLDKQFVSVTTTNKLVRGPVQGYVHNGNVYTFAHLAAVRLHSPSRLQIAVLQFPPSQLTGIRQLSPELPLNETELAKQTAIAIVKGRKTIRLDIRKYD